MARAIRKPTPKNRKTIAKTTSNRKDIANEAVAKLSEKGEAALEEVSERSRHYLDEATQRVYEAYDRAAQPVRSGASDTIRSNRDRLEATQAFARDNPMTIGLTGVATGLILGVFLMSCRR